MIRRVFRRLPPNNESSVTYGGEDLSEVAEHLDDAHVITSEIDDGLRKEPLYAPVLDLDVSHTYWPSSTPGHGHLLLDVALTADEQKELLTALAKFGIIEQGYADVSIKRGYTAVRLPWVSKVPQPRTARRRGRGAEPRDAMTTVRLRRDNRTVAAARAFRERPRFPGSPTNPGPVDWDSVPLPTTPTPAPVVADRNGTDEQQRAYWRQWMLDSLNVV